MKLKYYLRTLGIGIVVTALLMGISVNKQNKITDEEIRERAKQLGMVEADAYVLSDLKESQPNAEAEASTVEEESASGENSRENSLPEEGSEEESLPEEGSEEESVPEESSEEESVPEESSEEESVPEESSGEESLSEESSGEESLSEEGSEEESVPEESSEEESTPEESSEESSANEEESPSETESETQPDDNSDVVLFTVNRGDSSDKVSRRLEELGLVEDADEFDKYLCRNGYDNRISVGTYEIIKGSTWEEIAKIITRRSIVKVNSTL